VSTSFGDVLRAHRLGYRWVAGLQRWVRMEMGIPGDGKPGEFYVYLARHASDMTFKGMRTNYVCWWEGDDDAAIQILALSPALRRLADGIDPLPDGPLMLVLDDAGEKVLASPEPAA
jgi:hypothetical protein